MKTKLLLFFSAFLLFACTSNREKAGNPQDFIPEDTALLIRSNSFQTLATDIKNNPFLNSFSKWDSFSFFSEELNWHNYLEPESEVLIALPSSKKDTGEFTVITRQHANLFTLDSLKDKKIETVQEADLTFQKVSTSSGVLYSTIKDSVFLLSPSRENLKQILQQEKTPDPLLEKAYATGKNKPITVFVKGETLAGYYDRFFPEGPKRNLPLASWLTLDATIAPGNLSINGIALCQEGSDEFLRIFENTRPQTNELAKVTPKSAVGFLSFTYDDFSTVQKNLRELQTSTDSSASRNEFFQSLNEIGVIHNPKNHIIAAHAIDGEITEEILLPLLSESETFRDVRIQNFQDSTMFQRELHPLLPKTSATYMARMDEFFLFAASPELIKEAITEYKNETALGFQPFYQEHLAKLSTESSLLAVGRVPEVQKLAGEYAAETKQEDIKGLDLASLPLLAIQFVQDDGFAHLNAIVKESSQQTRRKGLSQLFAIELENELLNRPQFFSNHLNKGKDIVVQDVANKLYLISANGKVLWNKQLESAVVGDVQEVDILKNGKKQLAFATKNKFYILDRNGKEVAPFPISFRDEITQPLAVFDYDNNRDYRFIITQGKEILMLDRKGKTVTGFTFRKAGSKVLFPPKHIRMGAKDYIVVAEESGKLHILHRTGKSRVSVNNTFSFGRSEIYSEDGNFVFISDKNAKISIDQKGKVSTQNLNTTADLQWEIRGNNKATLDDNILRINNNKIELPFGIYSSPKISFSNRRVLVSVTDLQQQRSYAYTSLGELLPDFPVYGTSIMEFGDATNNGRPNAVVQGGTKEVVLYEIP